MQVIKKMIFSMLLLSESSTYCSDPGSMAVMAIIAVANFTIQSGKDLAGYCYPNAEKKLSAALAEEKLKYVAAEQRLNSAIAEEKAKYAVAEQELKAIAVEENLEYAKAKHTLRKCLEKIEGQIARDKNGYPIGCEEPARKFVACGGQEEMDIMIDNINRSRVE